MKEKMRLVRDQIPDLIEKDKRKCSYRILDDNEYLQALKEKLIEEVHEFISSENPEEVADILEVIECYLQAKNVSMDQVKDIQGRKRQVNGSFQRKIFLIAYEAGLGAGG